MSPTDGELFRPSLEAHFAVRGLDVPQTPTPDDWPEDVRGLVALARGLPFERRELSPGYGAEVAALGRRFLLEDRAVLARTRYATQEAVVLDALSLDSAYGS